MLQKEADRDIFFKLKILLVALGLKSIPSFIRCNMCGFADELGCPYCGWRD